MNSEKDQQTNLYSEGVSENNETGNPGDEKEITKLSEEVELEKIKNKELYDKYLRSQAELENYKKRIEREKCEYYKFALEKFIKDILPVLDNFELAIKSAEQNRDFNSFAEGITMIYQQLKDILENEGLNYECAIGEIFDPCKHEAVMQIESKGHEKNQIVEELKRGYFLKGKLLRPAMVSVAKGEENQNKSGPDKNKNNDEIKINNQ